MKRRETLFECVVVLALKHELRTLSKLESTNQIKANQLLVFEEREKLECLGKNLSEQSREPTNSIHI